MWFQTLSALCLAATTWAAISTDDDGVKSIGLRTHSLQQPYLDSDMQSRWVPLTATNWEIEVEFKIHGKNQLYGDGFAMWLTKQRGQAGPVFGSIDKFEGLGIFFDTYKNNRPGVVFPYVMAMVGDGHTSYDKDTDGKPNEFAGCSARGLRHASVPTKFRLTYYEDKYLKLDLQYKSEGEWTLCFETNEPPKIPQVAYLGFSAETGELSDNHDIISVQARNIYSSSPSTKSSPGSGRKGGKYTSDEKKGSWTWFFMKIILFCLVVAGGYVGFTAWRTNQKRSHRF
ncbi:uncharacterized protein E0L32_012192 [Thyridium curvatum]|uniref:L-type lectin-like domain-containing protein n=1 Tax=Thyridium curvatum TaxID=1093900 RepID=A0A507BBR1_9PEZI|nr:uncharacterized protein E0L32_012192 [Thyridium curvatum]TPX17337.1 hypothetical protein E0L32_012192 [Thyridium curvatum]